MNLSESDISYKEKMLQVAMYRGSDASHRERNGVTGGRNAEIR